MEIQRHTSIRMVSSESQVMAVSLSTLFREAPLAAVNMNPDETVWAHVKRKVSTRLVGSAEKMKRFALGALRSIQKLPALVKSFFRHPDCRYILDDVTC
jgi:hypothetical protein